MSKMITFVKIHGDKVNEAMDALRNLSVNMPEICVMDKALYSQLKDTYPIERGGWIWQPSTMLNFDEGILTMFRGAERVGHLKCDSVISKKGHKLGDSDVLFEWHKKPTTEQMASLEKQIDEVLKPLNVKYTIKNEEEPITDIG